jgi:hypothetical protein
VLPQNSVTGYPHWPTIRHRDSGLVTPLPIAKMWPEVAHLDGAKAHT